MKKLQITSLLLLVLFSTFLASCDSTNIISDIISNEVTAKDRLESANSQAESSYPGAQLVLVMGRNVNTAGKTDITGLTALLSPDQIGAWLYVYKVPGDTSLRVYTPNPVPGARDCINLTSFFTINTLVNLVPDTLARNLISGTLNLVNQSPIYIRTQSNVLIDSDVSLGYANTTNPIIKFGSSFLPSQSQTNGNKFFATGSNQTINMFLLPALGSLGLPDVIANGLFGLPQDLWIVNYKKTLSGAETNLVLGTVVQTGQTMGIDGFAGLSTRVINISNFLEELP